MALHICEKEPILSIVIANYNYGRFLEEAIRSVVMQEGFDECELIVCDAASTDESVEIIRNYEDKLTWWCSEKDGGQSAAFNKGFAHSRGRYLTWLNADDILVSGSLIKILGEMKKHQECEWFTGNFFRFTHDSGIVTEIGWGPHVYPQSLQFSSSPVVVFGPTSFFSRRIYLSVGKIDERLHYIMDVDLWLAFMKNGILQRRINCFCWGFRLHDLSKTGEYGEHERSEAAKKQGVLEEEIVRAKHHYKCSKFLRFLVVALRVIDGSLVRCFAYCYRYVGGKYTHVIA